MNPQKVNVAANIGRKVCKPILGQAFNTTSRLGLHSSYALVYHQGPPSRRNFSSSTRTQLEFFPPPKNAPNIKLTPPAWKHPICDEQHMKAIAIAHREPRTFSDRWAYQMVRLLRWGTDIATGYKHDSSKPYVMNERKWMVRFIFLETVAGVPGMVGGMLRHFRSLRSMKRDNGWQVFPFDSRATLTTPRIETLLEDAYNERMHLLTFLKMAEPGKFMKLMILGAQGVFVNGFFLSYLVAPKSCHRFVGYLEEEAVHTYTLALQDLEDGKLPGWNDLDAPEIAIRYWSMPEGHRKMKDLLLYIRADEAKHREIHHTFANLNQAEDPNPFASEYKDEGIPHPGRGIEHIRAEGWERKDVL